jgi:hypothetical protein
METVKVNTVGQRFNSINGLEFEVKQLEGAVAFCSRVVDGKVKKGRPSKFLVYGLTEDTIDYNTDDVPDVITTNPTAEELDLEINF